MSKKNLAPGSLDPTFGDQGAVRVPFPGFPEIDVRSVLELPDKKLLVATVGWFQEPARIWRLNEDGTLDTRFGDGGGLDIALKDAEMYFISAFSALSDGGWLVAGSYQATNNATGLALVRFRADGQLDELFGEQGVRFLPFDEMGQPGKPGSPKRRRIMAQNSVGSGHNVAQQVDGKIVFVTSVYMDELSRFKGIVLRFNSDGSNDNTFNDHGFALIDIEDDAIVGVYGLGVVTQPDGKVVACGRFITRSPLIQRGFIVRFDKAGRLDGEFNNGAPVIIAHENSVIFETVTIRKSDGAIIAVGSAARVGVMLSTVVVLNSSGSFNLVFNNGKPLLSNLAPAGGHWKFCEAKPDGSILVGGYSSIRLINASDAFMTARYLANGSLDPLFNGQGYAVFDDEMPLFFRHVALLKDDRIAACGGILTPDFMGLVGGWIVRYQV